MRERRLVCFAFMALVAGLYFPLAALAASPVMACWIVVFSWPAWAGALNAAAIGWTLLPHFNVVS